ncbi:hypothetical protein LguiB_031821 [Lonicera macranthoides]
MDQGYGSTSSTSRGEYEVFLSFNGTDTRKGFTDFLYTYLVDADIRTFRDDNVLRVGEEIGPELLKAIKESKISIPIFSKNYASSKWCLRELAQIVECHTNEGQMIYPIFYDVNPYEVRHQSGSYKDAFSQHKNNFDEMTIQGWKEAMRKVGQLKGLELIKETNGLEGQLVKKVLQDVMLGLEKNYTQLPGNLVGLDDHIKAMKELLNLRMHDQLRDLGREIVREENMSKPGNRSRLWCTEHASKLWEGCMVTQNVEALNLGLHAGSLFDPQCLVGKDFKKLRNLRLLRLGYANLDGDFKQCLPNLRWLDWKCFGNIWPTNFHLKNLVVLNLSVINIPDNWEGWSGIKMAKELRVLDLSMSSGFGTLDCSSFSALENLNLRDCSELRRLDGLEQLKSLRYLNLNNCWELEILLDLSNFKKLKKLDIARCMMLTGIQGLDGLELFDVLDMLDCKSIQRLRGLSNLRRLKRLNLQFCSNLRELDEVGVLESLEHLDMTDCRYIERLPDLSKLTKLKKLNLSGCVMLREVKGLSVLKSLEILDLSGCYSMEEFPDLSNLKKLVELSIWGWDDLTEIRGLEELKSLELLDISFCSSIGQLPDLSNHINLCEINVSYCEKLTEIRGIEELKSLNYMNVGMELDLDVLHKMSTDFVSKGLVIYIKDSSSSANPHDEPQSLGTWRLFELLVFVSTLVDSAWSAHYTYWCCHFGIGQDDTSAVALLFSSQASGATIKAKTTSISTIIFASKQVSSMRISKALLRLLKWPLIIPELGCVAPSLYSKFSFSQCFGFASYVPSMLSTVLNSHKLFPEN